MSDQQQQQCNAFQLSPLILDSSDSDNDNNTLVSWNTDHSSDTVSEENEENIFIRNDSRDELLRGDINMKIRTWALRNITSLSHKCLDELLFILKNEGYTNLPQSSKTLLYTNKAKNNIRLMLGKNERYGHFNYFNIKDTLKNIISVDTYRAKYISLLINIDGASVHHSSRKHIWTILGLVSHPQYNAKPFLIGLYYGESKPMSVNEFLENFIIEVNDLITNGINIGNCHYIFNIKAFVCDTPARAYIKCCKGHGGFFACERCEIKGKTIEGKRIYKGVNNAERTNESFRRKRQADHHSVTKESPLLDIIGFDIIKSVVLDPMHLLCLGISKFLLQELLHGSRQNRIGLCNITLLQTSLNSISRDIPIEFQRKNFDLSDITNWKATQFRFFLLYCSGLILSQILPHDTYRHFMLLYVSCRLLSSEKLAVRYAKYAKVLLRKFVALMPKYYGETSLTITIHNLIHIADDVIHMKEPLFKFSAFPFEDCIGFIKKLLRNTTRIIPQIVRRIHEMQQGNVPSIQCHYPLLYVVTKINDAAEGHVTEITDGKIILSSIKIKNMTFSTIRPNNVAMMNNNDVIRISNMFIETNNPTLVTLLFKAKNYFFLAMYLIIFYHHVKLVLCMFIKAEPLCNITPNIFQQNVFILNLMRRKLS